LKIIPLLLRRLSWLYYDWPRGKPFDFDETLQKALPVIEAAHRKIAFRRATSQEMKEAGIGQGGIVAESPPECRWHKDEGRPELDHLMQRLSQIKVKVPAWQGSPLIETNLADVVKHPTAFCPDQLTLA